MHIASVASAFPKYRYKQSTLAAAFARHWGPEIAASVPLARIHSRVGVETRHLAYPIETYERLKTWGEANDLWIAAALDLGQKAVCRALARADVSRSEIGAIFFVSISGIASPSIDARLVNLMGLSPNIKRIPIFGLGCVGGAAGIARASDYVKAYPDQVALVLSVELCSLTIQRDDLSMANLISTGLFGDGAAAVLVSGSNRDRHELSGPKIVETRSVFYPDSEHVMGWAVSEKGFRIVLSPEVPHVVKKFLARDVDAFLAGEGLTRADIDSWILHTGGPKVLEATAEALELRDGALDVSWRCLSETGNLSSASVLVVLEQFTTKHRPCEGSYSVLAAMGPGFCSELVLLRW
ncbi:MAG: type III polyketide synthase [Bryobacteraceae bacterium]